MNIFTLSVIVVLMCYYKQHIFCYRETDFLETVPKAKLRRLKWVQMFNCLKQGILDDMVHELNVMWEYEDMPQKLEILDKQKEKFAENDKQLW